VTDSHTVSGGRRPGLGRLDRWAWVLVAARIVLSIGTPLIGLRVFHATDMLNLMPPWQADAPYGFRPQSPPVSDTVNVVPP